MNLSKSQARYIQTVYDLSFGNQGVRVCDIAQCMGYSKASVSLAMSKLEMRDLVYKNKHHHIFLTTQGERLAVQMLNKFDVLEHTLAEMLGVSRETAARDAAAIGNIVSVDTLCALCRLGKGRNRNHRCLRSCDIAGPAIPYMQKGTE